ncbi:hypothetical protein ERJ75_000957300 [Trypanosoma vivax]|nr:hypothetical protein ERJ75_000957300 [Trypanosoma vivax]
MESVKGSLQRVQQRASESDQLLSAVGTLMAAGDALRAERMDAVLSTVGAAVTELAHQREEHVAAVDVLEREVVSARTAMEQQRAEFEKRALDLRTAHEREWLELADSSSLLVAECVSWRQAVAQEEAVARLDLVIDLQQSSMSCASREHAECLMLEGHVAFGEYCAREHAAWMDDAGEVLLEALGTCGSRAMEYARLQLADCSQCETEARAVLLECEDSEYQLLVAYMNVRLGHCFELSKVFDAIVFGLCDPSSADSLTSDCSSYPHCLTLSPYVSCLIMLEQYRQLASLEYATYFSSLFESRNVSAFDSRREFEMTLSAVEEHHHDKLSQLIRENKSLEEKLQILRENLDFQANLEELEEEVLHDRTLSACGNVSSCRPLPSSGNAAVDLNNSSQRWEGLNFSNYLSSIFGRDMSSKGRSIAQRDISPQTRVQKRLKNELSDFCNNSASDMSRELYLTPPLHSPSSSMVWNSRNESFSQR